MKLEVISLLSITVLVITAAAAVADGRVDRVEALRETVPAYTIAMNAGLLSPGGCKRDLKHFLDSVEHRKLWSMKMLDASGQAAPGFLMGNNYWRGSRTYCDDLSVTDDLPFAHDMLANNSRYRDVNEEFPPYEVHFYVAHLRHNSTMQYQSSLPYQDVITLGLCLPATCTTEELTTILEKIIRERTLLFQDVFLADLQVLEVKDLRPDYSIFLHGIVIFVGICFALAILLVIAGTAHDIIARRRLRMKEKLVSCENNNMCEMKCGNENEELELPAVVTHSKWAKVLQCFSLYENSLHLFDTKEDAQVLPALHGLRFLGMMWIVAAHIGLYGSIYYDNQILALRFTERFSLQILRNAAYSVDTYLFLSGFLLSYTYFKKVAKDNRREPKSHSYKAMLSEYFTLLFKRYIRLTPTYFLIIGLELVWALWLQSTSMFLPLEYDEDSCLNYWWANLLYVNNLLGRERLCMSWSWYLACDMQYYVVGSALLILSTAHFNLAAALLGSLLVGSTVISGYAAYVTNFNFTLVDYYRKQEQLYYAPWVRINPHIIGMVTGYLLTKINHRLKLSKKTKALLWCMGCCINGSLLAAFWKVEFTALSAAALFAVAKTAWGLGIAWLVLACCTNNGGIINKFLSFKGFVPLSRLTYCAYLFNPMIIQNMFRSGESAGHMDAFYMYILGLGFFMASYVAAYLFAILAEVPYRRLLYLYLNKRNKVT